MHKEQMLRDVLVYLNTDRTHVPIGYFDVFSLAFWHNKQTEHCQSQYDKWLNGGKLPLIVEDFSLDVLTNKMYPTLKKLKARKRLE